MLKYLLSTLCIFLFFEDVRLNIYKCASLDCSVLISKATVQSFYLAKSKQEVNVKPGQVVSIHGIDAEKENYLVKVKESDGFHLLPAKFLKENTNILQKAKVEVTDPFKRNQSSHMKALSNQGQSRELDRFNSIVLNISCLSCVRKVSSDPANQFPSDENLDEEKSFIDAETPKSEETTTNKSESLKRVPADKKILENNTISKDDKPDYSNLKTNTLNETTKNSSEFTQDDSTEKNPNETNINKTEESDDVTVEDVNENSVEQKNKSKLSETERKKKYNSSDFSTSDNNSSNQPSKETAPDHSTFEPKVSHGDDPATISTNLAGLYNITSDENQTSTVGNESSNMNSSYDPGLNETDTPVNQSNSSMKPKPDAINSTIVTKNETTVSKPDNSALKQNGTSEKQKDIAEIDKKEELQGSAPSASNASEPSKNKEKSASPSPSEDPERSNRSASENKSGPSSNNASSDSNTTDSTKKKKEGAETPKANPDKRDEQENTTLPNVKNEETHSQETMSTAASPDSNFSSSTVKPPELNDHNTASPKPSNKNGSDSDVSVPSLERTTKNEDAIQNIPTFDSSKEKDEPESNPKHQTNPAKPSDSSQEKENESAPSSQFPDALPKNPNYMITDQATDKSEDSNQSSEDVTSKEESAFYSDIFGYISNFFSLFENLAVLQNYLNFEWLQKKNESMEQPHCNEESCSAFSIFDSMAKYGFDVSAINLQSWSLAELHESKQTSLVAGILLCAVLLFTTLISILRNSKKKSRINTLISAVNQLEKKLLVATKEISLLEEQLTDSPMTLISQPAMEVDYESNELLQQQIELLQVQNTDLEDKVTYLEKELHNVTTSAFEMHKLLENSLSTQAQSKLAEDEVDTLRALTERQDRQIDELMKDMDAIVTENRYFKEDLKKMEKEFSSQTKKNLELSEKNRNLSLRLDQQIEETATMKNNYKSEIYQLQAKIEDLEINLRRSEFQVESLNRAFMDKHENRSDDQIQALQDDVQLKLQLSTLKAMNNELSAELKEQKNARRTLDDHIGDVIRKCNELTQALEASEKGRSEAVNKLQVLTDYFNEKESQLQKDIAAKEKLFMESENKDQLLSQKLSSLKEEIKNNKDRNEELKKEIEAQERSFKTQLATAEQKSRDLWFASRQAERKYQESEKEAATLRNKILILENNLSSANQKLNEKHSTNGDINGQSLMFSAEMLSYRGPNDFIPPPPSPLASHSPEFFPPEPSYSPDERLPPLGGRRVPSPPSLIVPPPEDDDFNPPLPHAQYMPGRSRHDSLNMASYYGDNTQFN